ncbi:MAG: DNA maturase B [Podoviridae sp. ctLUJ1]|nr:MAG: DNA maturase B [Podoviridae sp. ctLUJ1]
MHNALATKELPKEETASVMPVGINDDDGVNRSLEKLLMEVNYHFLNNLYVPSVNAIKFINFIKLVNGAKGEENKSPVIHMHMLDQAIAHSNNLFVSFRGSAKTTALHEYVYLYIAVYGEFFDFGVVDVAMYISDTMENGVKNMRNNLEYRYNNSEFLQKYVPYTRFTDSRWEFKNIDGKRFCIRGFGANTGVRGFKEYGKRPTFCGFDDLMSDKNAESPTIIKDMRNIIYKAARQAMHPKKRKIIWTGTPFNKKDPLYKAAGSPSWHTSVYPICERFPCSREDFRGAWEDRFNYDFVKNEYDTLLDNGEISAFNQELMLRISSEENRIVQDGDIRWFSRTSLIRNLPNFNVYIVTDFAVSEKESADFSTIGVFAYNHIGQWFLIDGICKRQTMDKNIDDLFKLCQIYSPKSVGVEVTGQQGGFISWIQREMMERNIFFNLASDGNGGTAGIRYTSNKFHRFAATAVPWFKLGLIHLPEEYKTDPLVRELIDELSSATTEGFKSEHDDACDLITMLTVMNAWKPSPSQTQNYNPDIGWGYNEGEDEVGGGLESYLV